ncbi:EAL domain-containing protein [uncultured Pseudokineococcus sp.]|uniref:putative bifunctional diguanylate cyclase/phosphodiesterase n=1 Tax=uncultured Pseudokineococcus sp. TaxID=1642928 RepID=UPI00261191FE|nr:EAL domain-containing protein [uncultured Pseudokineococcus sp.]
MRAVEVLRRPWTAWAVLGLVALGGAVVALQPAARGPGVVLAPAVAAALVLAGVALHRPAGARVWLVQAGVLAALSLGQVLDAGALLALRAASDGVTHAVAAAVVVLLAVRTGRRAGRPDALEVGVIVGVLGLAVAQAAVLLATWSPAARAALMASTDVVLLASVLRMALTRRDARSVASWCCVAAAGALLLHDVLRLAGDGAGGEGDVAGGAAGAAALVVGLGLLGAAQLHPSARRLLDAEHMAPARRRSTVVLGLLPLVLVPVGLRLVDLTVGGTGLPTWAHLAVGTAAAVAGVLRSWAALRGSEHLADHDPLTDLPNRRALAQAHAESPGGDGWALLLVDLDDFKDVNDAHGHDVGDLLLLGVRDRLLAAVGEHGVVARFGGDEFAVLVRPGAQDDVAGAVVTALRRPLGVGDLVLRTSASVGLAPPAPGTSLAEQLTRADVALYAAKAAGRDAVRTYHPDQRAEVQQRYALSSQVRALLAGRSPSVGRLEVHFQPLVELATGEVVGAEALVRWRHPEHGLLAPDAFLGHVATSGLDAELDAAVLVDVLEQLGRWRDQRRRALPVSVNLTRTSLLDTTLPGRVREALARAGVPGSQLHLEITEHEPLPDDERLLEVLRGLRALGAGVHLDDYGRGYTSLDYLQRFPVQVLKIDRSVVVGAGAGGARLVAGLVAMARTLRLDLLAEGVETPEQRRRLVDQGVRYGQGWLFSPALPAAEYADRVLGPAAAPAPPPDVPAPRLPLGDAVVRPRPEVPSVDAGGDVRRAEAPRG